MLHDLFKKNIKFRVIRYEEWQGGQILSEGCLDAYITGETHEKGINFTVDPFDSQKMEPECDADYTCSAELGDRIQYLSMSAASSCNPLKPILVQLFAGKDGALNCIRYAMSYPDRIIEFYGYQVVATVAQLKKAHTGILSSDEMKAMAQGLENARRSYIAPLDGMDKATYDVLAKMFRGTLGYAWKKYGYGNPDILPGEEMPVFEGSLRKLLPMMRHTLSEGRLFAHSGEGSMLNECFGRLFTDLQNIDE